MRMFRKTLKSGTNIARRVGKATRRTLKRGTNTLGLTRRRKGGRRRSSRR